MDGVCECWEVQESYLFCDLFCEGESLCTWYHDLTDLIAEYVKTIEISVGLKIRIASTNSNEGKNIFSPTYTLLPDQSNTVIQATKDIGTYLEFTLNYLGLVSAFNFKNISIETSN